MLDFYNRERMAELKLRLERANQLQEENADKLAAGLLITFLEVWFENELEQVGYKPVQNV